MPETPNEQTSEAVERAVGVQAQVSTPRYDWAAVRRSLIAGEELSRRAWRESEAMQHIPPEVLHMRLR